MEVVEGDGQETRGGGRFGRSILNCIVVAWGFSELIDAERPESKNSVFIDDNSSLIALYSCKRPPPPLCIVGESTHHDRCV